MSKIRGLLQRKQDGASESASDAPSEDEGDADKETTKKSGGGFGFGRLNIISGLKKLNPIKSLGKKPVKQPGKTAPPPPLKKIAWLFGPKHRDDLWRLSPYLSFHDLGRLAQINEACNEHLIQYFQSGPCMAKHAIPKTYWVYQTLLRDHYLSRNRGAADYDLPALILSFLTIPEQVHLSQVCRRMIGIHSAMDLRIRGREQHVAFLHGFNVQRKQFHAIKCRYTRTNYLHCAYLTSHQMKLMTLVVQHGCFPKLKHLDFSHVQMSDDSLDLAKSVEEMLSHVGDQLESLVLRGIPWSEASYAVLIPHLSKHPLVNLKHLDLAETPLDHVTLFRIAPNFSRNHFANLTTLDIQDTGLHSSSFPALLGIVIYLPLLTSLNISRNELSVAVWKALAVHMKEESNIFSTLHSFDCSGCSFNVEGMLIFMEALRECRCPNLTKLDVSGNFISKEAAVALGRAFVKETVPKLSHLNLTSTSLEAEGVELLGNAFSDKLYYHKSHQKHHGMPGHSLEALNLTANTIGKGFLGILAAMTAKSFVRLKSLSLAKTGLKTSDFDLLAQTLKADCCPQLVHLNLSDNEAKGEGLTRFCFFFETAAAARIRHLDLSHNLLDTFSLLRLSEALRLGRCVKLHVLNVSRNFKVDHYTLYHFNETVRSSVCPSLRCLQIGDLVTPEAGFSMVQRLKKTYSSADVADRRDKLREEKRAAFTRKSEQDAIATDIRTKMKCAIRRELYDRLEDEAARANLVTHVKKPPKTKLAIHRKIQQEILETMSH
ncbi:hypothetical protein AC1031_018300 [Aphanomyces cochlioides]|nr:hypothetical protein AC1031_018300 [Aphanomyces cochlioides]